MARTEGQRLLRKYLDDNGLAQRTLAQKLKRSEAQVSLWLSGQNLPDVVSAGLLEEITDGAVPAKAWSEKPRRTKAA